MDDIKKEIQDWILAQERAGRCIDMNHVNEQLRIITARRNSMPREEFNGFSPEEMHNFIYYPFSSVCPVKLNVLTKAQYEKIPLVRQALFLLHTLSKTELKLTKLGWLPLKVVAEAYTLGQPEWYIEEFNQKRINEYEANSVWMARIIIDLLGWIKKRNGNLSLTAKGRKALSNIDEVANDILHFSLTGGVLHNFDGYKEDQIGNYGIAYSVWLLNKYGSEWHSGNFYEEHYQKAFNFPNGCNGYETRVLSRLFYWLGIVEKRPNKEMPTSFAWEYHKTDLLPMIFSIQD